MSIETRTLLEEKGSLASELKHLDGAKQEDRAKGEQMIARMTEIDNQISFAAKQSEAQVVTERSHIVADTRAHGRSDAVNQRDYNMAIRGWMLGNKIGTHPDAKHMRAAAEKCQINLADSQLDLSREARAAATSDPIGWGAGGSSDVHVASLVPQTMSGEIEKYMNAYGGIREKARVITTDGGGTLTWPVINESTVRGRMVAENIQATVQTFASTVINFSAFKYNSDIVRVSVESLQDAGVPMESIVAELLGNRIARIKAYYYAVGASSDGGVPDGLVGGTTAFTTSKVSGYSGSCGVAFASTDLLALYHDIDPNYRRNGTWVFNDDTLMKIKAATLFSTYYYPIWQPSLAAGEVDTILGKPYVIDQDMPSFPGSSDSGNKPICFGDLSKYVIRDVKGLTLVRFDEKYMDYYQLGFMAIARGDAHVINPQAIKHLACQAASS